MTFWNILRSWLFNFFVNRNWKKLADSRKRAKILADNRKCHHPIETLLVYSKWWSTNSAWTKGLDHVSCGRLQEFKNNERQTICSKSGHFCLWELVVYDRFLLNSFDYENWVLLDRWSLTEGAVRSRTLREGSTVFICTVCH